jgi:hypothetical protein
VRKCFTFLILLVSGVVYSETPTWYEGSLVLKTSQVLKGQISVQTANDMILFKSDDKLMVYTADKISSFFFYDHANNINRKYISLQEKINAFTTTHLYEVVLYGEIKVLRKLIFPFSDPTDDRNSYQYFVLFNRELSALNKFRTSIYPAIVNGSELTSKFVEEGKLNPNLRADAIRIIAYYNKECRSKSHVALKLSQNKPVVPSASVF